MFKLYVHFVETVRNYCFDFCINKWEPTFWQNTCMRKVWNIWWTHFRRCSMRSSGIIAVLRASHYHCNIVSWTNIA